MKVVFGICVSAAMLGAIAAAAAADMPVKAPPPPLVVLPQTTGWYVVGGGVIMFDGRGTANFDGDCADPARLVPCGATSRVDVRDGFAGFAGVGYRFVSWLRGEVRIGYGAAKNTLTIDPLPPAYLGVRTVTSDADSIIGLANAYVDFAGLLPKGTLGAFEPYVGAGVGAARTRLTNVVETNTLSPPGVMLLHPGGTTTGFVWSAAVGTAVRLSTFGLPQGLLFDVAYRYLDFGNLSPDAGNLMIQTPAGIVPAKFQRGFSGHGQAHGIELALRYELPPR